MKILKTLTKQSSILGVSFLLFIGMFTFSGGLWAAWGSCKWTGTVTHGGACVTLNSWQAALNFIPGASIDGSSSVSSSEGKDTCTWSGSITLPVLLEQNCKTTSLPDALTAAFSNIVKTTTSVLYTAPNTSPALAAPAPASAPAPAPASAPAPAIDLWQ